MVLLVLASAAALSFASSGPTMLLSYFKNNFKTTGNL